MGDHDVSWACFARKAWGHRLAFVFFGLIMWFICFKQQISNKNLEFINVNRLYSEPVGTLNDHVAVLQAEVDEENKAGANNGSLKHALKIDEIRTSEVYFATYATDQPNFKRAKDRICAEANHTLWFRSVHQFGPGNITAEFRAKAGGVLAKRRGGGYWIWKISVIFDMLSKMKENDILVYADAGCILNNSPAATLRFQEYLDLVNNSSTPLIGFTLKSMERKYTSNRIFDFFNVSADSPIRSSAQLVGGILIMRKGPHVRKWLALIYRAFNADPWLWSDKYNQEAKRADSQFFDNRHDQSIFSVTRKLIGCILLPDDTYPPSQSNKPIWAARKKQ